MQENLVIYVSKQTYAPKYILLYDYIQCRRPTYADIINQDFNLNPLKQEMKIDETNK